MEIKIKSLSSELDANQRESLLKENERFQSEKARVELNAQIIVSKKKNAETESLLKEQLDLVQSLQNELKGLFQKKVI